MTLYLWKISQTENTGYDTYDSAVVVAADEASAKRIHPSAEFCIGWGLLGDRETWLGRFAPDARNGLGGQLYDFSGNDWASSPDEVSAVCVGEANDFQVGDGDVVCASFNAG